MNFEWLLEQCTSTLKQWATVASEHLPHIAVVILLFIVAGYVKGFWISFVHTTAKKLTKNSSITQLTTLLAKVGFFLVVAMLALKVLKLDEAVNSILAGAGIAGLAIGFAFQEVISNLLSGLLLISRGSIRQGDIVQIGGEMGTVEKIELRSTEIKTFDGILLIVPNKKFISEPFTNLSTEGERRIVFEVGVGYESNLEEVERVAKKALNNLSTIKKENPAEVYCTGFGNSCINLMGIVWIPYPGENHYYRTVHAGIVAIHKAFKENGINIPFPIRTLDIRQGNLEKFQIPTHQNQENAPLQ